MDILQPDSVRAIVFERPNLIEDELDFSSDIVILFVERIGTICEEMFNDC